MCTEYFRENLWLPFIQSLDIIDFGRRPDHSMFDFVLRHGILRIESGWRRSRSEAVQADLLWHAGVHSYTKHHLRGGKFR